MTHRTWLPLSMKPRGTRCCSPAVRIRERTSEVHTKQKSDCYEKQPIFMKVLISISIRIQPENRTIHFRPPYTTTDCYRNAQAQLMKCKFIKSYCIRIVLNTRPKSVYFEAPEFQLLISAFTVPSSASLVLCLREPAQLNSRHVM